MKQSRYLPMPSNKTQKMFTACHGLGWAYQEQGKKNEQAKAQNCRLVNIKDAPLDLKKECSARVKALDMNCDG